MHTHNSFLRVVHAGLCATYLLVQYGVDRPEGLPATPSAGERGATERCSHPCNTPYRSNAAMPPCVACNNATVHRCNDVVLRWLQRTAASHAHARMHPSCVRLRVRVPMQLHAPRAIFPQSRSRTALLHNDHAAIDCVAAVRSKRHKPKAKAAAAVAGQERYPRLIDVKDQAIPLIYPQSH